MTQKFDKKEQSILELDELFKDIGEDVRIANQAVLKKHNKSTQKETKKIRLD